MKKIVSLIGIFVLLIGVFFVGIIPAKAATITSITYTPSGATVGTAVAASSTVAAFTPITAIAASSDIILTFPANTTLANIVAGDFTIEQAAHEGNTPGAATAPSVIAFNNTAKTITLTVDAASLSTGTGAGLGVVTIKTSGTAGGNEITHPTTATTSGSFTVATASDTGTISNVVFVAATLDNFLVAITPTSALTGQNLATTITARDQYNNTTTVGFSGNVAMTTNVGGSLVYPATITNASFTSGVWSGNLRLDKAGSHTVTATGNTKTGTDTITITANSVTTLLCEASGQAGAIWLRWTEPAQAVSGMFGGFVAKHYAAALTDGNWGSGTTITQTWSPASAQGGSNQQLVIGLNPGTRYYFGLTLGSGSDTIASVVSNSPSCIAPASSVSSIDSIAPVSRITSPATKASVLANKPLVIKGTALDSGGSSTQKVEISIDNGLSWNQTTVLENIDGNLVWEFAWQNPTIGAYTIKTRAYDWAGNIETPGAGIEITVVSSLPETPATEKPISQMTAQEIETKIVEIQQKIIQVLQQLIQIIQQQIQTLAR